MGTTDQMSTIDTYPKKKKQLKHNTKNSHQTTRREHNKKEDWYKQIQNN